MSACHASSGAWPCDSHYYTTKFLSLSYKLLAGLCLCRIDLNATSNRKSRVSGIRTDSAQKE